MDKVKTGSSAATVTRIMAGDDRTRYDGFAITLHWLTAVLVIAQFGLAETWGLAARPARHVMIVSHMSLGILLSVVLLIRLAWRMIPGHQISPAGSGWVELASKGMHYLLYGLLMAEAMLGYTFRWSGDEAMSFFGILIPSPLPAFSRAAHHLVAEAHDWIGWIIVVLAAGHAAAALFHQYVLRDDLLWRMLPTRHAQREGPAPARTSTAPR